MGTISVVPENRQNVCISPISEKKQEETELPLYSYEVKDWEEATNLVYFHTSGQYVGTDGKSYQMAAEYADDATKVFPTVQVTITDESGNASKYHIEINKIDTSNATEIEMFALCSHADTKRGRYKDISGDTLSSWESLLFYRKMEGQKGHSAQNDSGAVLGTKKYNWREMVSGVAETCMDDGMYDRYLNVNRMKDMLEYYSHFKKRPIAFEDTFHAIRDYEFIRVLSLDQNTNIEIYDKQKKVVCSDISLKRGSRELWSRTLTDEEYLKAIEIAGSPHKAYMKDYFFWDKILSGACKIEDYDVYVQELKRQKESMFANCPLSVKEAWERAEEETDFNGLGLTGNMEVKFVSEFMHVQMERMQKGMGTNLLGTSVKSAIEMAKQMIERLEEIEVNQMTTEDRTLKLKERVFYCHFLEYLDSTQKYNPAKLLLEE